MLSFLDLPFPQPITPENRLDHVLLAAAVYRILPLWGMRPGPNGLRCECRKGYSCLHPGKHPRQKGWLDAATQDLDVIRGWYKRWPHTNFGGVTGGSLVTVDIDSLDAVMWLEEVELAHGVRIPHTLAAKSGREDGGYHLTFRSPWPNVKSGKGRGHEKIDIRGARAYVVVPGSLHLSGQYYRWMDGCLPADIPPLPEMPWWMVDELLIQPLTGSRKTTSCRAGRAARCAPRKTGGGRSDRPYESDVFKESIQRFREQNGCDVTTAKIRRDVPPPKWKILDVFFDHSKRNYARNRATWERRRSPGTRYALPDQSPSAYEMALADAMACSKWTPQEMYDGLVLWRETHMPGEELPYRARLEVTVVKALLLAEDKGLIRKKRGPKKGTKYKRRGTFLDHWEGAEQKYSPISQYSAVALGMVVSGCAAPPICGGSGLEAATERSEGAVVVGYCRELPDAPGPEAVVELAPGMSWGGGGSMRIALDPFSDGVGIAMGAGEGNAVGAGVLLFGITAGGTSVWGCWDLAGP